MVRAPDHIGTMLALTPCLLAHANKSLRSVRSPSRYPVPNHVMQPCGHVPITSCHRSALAGQTSPSMSKLASARRRIAFVILLALCSPPLSPPRFAGSSCRQLRVWCLPMAQTPTELTSRNPGALIARLDPAIQYPSHPWLRHAPSTRLWLLDRPTKPGDGTMSYRATARRTAATMRSWVGSSRYACIGRLMTSSARRSVTGSPPSAQGKPP